MKKLSITKEQFEKSKYFKDKYGKLEYVSESGKLFKTSKGKLLKFKESRAMRPMKDKPNTDNFKSWSDLKREITASIRYAKTKVKMHVL